MKIKILLLLTFACVMFKISYCQFISESNFLDAKKYVVAIGTVKEVPVQSNNGEIIMKRNFVEIGSGLITYLKYDTATFETVVTAKHVANFFLENHLDTFFIRGSWADTLKSTDYFGVRIPKSYGPIHNVFLYPDSSIDLASILLPQSFFDSTSFANFSKDGNNVAFPYNSMSFPKLGDQVWIYGYPDHIESAIEQQFLYYIATLKPGYISWVPPHNFTNPDLNHVTIVESNATNGNSGGPVFSFDLRKGLQLVGILVAGYPERRTVLYNGKAIVDSTNKIAMYSDVRSGVSIIENAIYVKKMLEYVQGVFDGYRKKYHF